MRLISFNFDKLNVERISVTDEKIKINTNIDILDIQKAEVDLFNSKEELIHVRFVYSINYEPNFAKIEFRGNMFITLDSKDSQELFKKWKNKEIPEEMRLYFFNIILMKSNIKALQFEDELSIPLHVPLPRFSKEQNQDPKGSK